MRKVTRKSLVASLDKAFSIWVRSSPADHRGFSQCFTCGQFMHWKTMDAGHFQSRAKMSTRWAELNVKPQCKRCNGFRGGEQFIFARHLDRVHGTGTSEEIEILSNTTRKWSMDELRDMKEHYQAKIKELE